MPSTYKSDPITTTTTNMDDVNGYKELRDEIEQSDSLLRKTMRANGIFEKEDLKYNSCFYRTPRIDPYNHVHATHEYAFFVKPDCNILDNGNLSSDILNANVPYFQNLYKSGYNYTTLQDLSYSNGGGCPFVRILTNRKTSSIDIPDISVDEYETSQNDFGSKILYPKSSMASDENLDFSVEFEDTKSLEVYNFFKAYDIYRQLKWLGIVAPSQHFIENKILHDHMAIYKFIVDEDGETILFWAKWTGVYPKSISRSSFSDIQHQGPLKITVGFKLSGFFEDMTPNIISDFNSLVAKWITGDGSYTRGYSEMAWWDPDIQMVPQESVDFPYIGVDYPTADNGQQYAQYRLKWGKFNS